MACPVPRLVMAIKAAAQVEEQRAIILTNSFGKLLFGGSEGQGKKGNRKGGKSTKKAQAKPAERNPAQAAQTLMGLLKAREKKG